VLSGQDVLVDAPHLVSRFPSLLMGDRNKAETWNKTVTLSGQKELGLDDEKINDFVFQTTHWLSRTAWLWNRVYKCKKIKEVDEPWKMEKAKFAFCEDSSTFEKLEDCKEYKASVDSPYNYRCIRASKFQGVDYAPKVYLVQ